MRTMFFEMCLLNDTSQMRAISFIRNGKEWGEGKIKSESCGVLLRKGSDMGYKLKEGII